jgi:hypothetical protein
MGYTATMTLKRCADVLVLLDLMVCEYQNIYALLSCYCFYCCIIYVDIVGTMYILMIHIALLNAGTRVT